MKRKRTWKENQNVLGLVHNQLTEGFFFFRYLYSEVLIVFKDVPFISSRRSELYGRIDFLGRL